jgi:hypothetical protein
MEVDKLRGLGSEEFVVDKIRRVLDILDLLVCRGVAFGAERKGCRGLEVLSGGMQSASGDLSGLSRGRHCEGGSCSGSSRYSSSNGTRENSSHLQSSLNRLDPWWKSTVIYKVPLPHRKSSSSNPMRVDKALFGYRQYLPFCVSAAERTTPEKSPSPY